MGAAAIGAGAGLGLGLIKHNQDEAKYNRQKEMEAQKEKWSPWTGVHGQSPQMPGGAFESGIQGALGGAMFGQQLGAQGAPAPAAVASPIAGAQPVAPQVGGYGQSPWASLQRSPTLFG